MNNDKKHNRPQTDRKRPAVDLVAAHAARCRNLRHRAVTFHNLKAAGMISDTEGDKQKAGGHKTLSMVAVYDRKLPEVKPAGVK